MCMASGNINKYVNLGMKVFTINATAAAINAIPQIPAPAKAAVNIGAAIANIDTYRKMTADFPPLVKALVGVSLATASITLAVTAAAQLTSSLQNSSFLQPIPA